MEDQAFSPSHDLAPPPPPPPLSLHVCSRSSLLTGEGGGEGGAKSYGGEKAWSSMNHLILSSTAQYQPPGDNCEG
jgi:hypothetical protein